MLGRLFRLIWRLLKPVRVAVRIGFYVWLVTFPLYGLHLIQGMIDGAIMAYMEDSYDFQGYNAFVANMRSVRMFQFAEVPGAPRMDEIGLDPFHVPLVRNPSQWWKRLGMEKDLGGDAAAAPWDEFEAVKRLAHPHGLYRKQDDKSEQPWHHWVYASPSYIIGPGGLYNEWDIAFNEILQHHYATPAAHNATFRVIACGRSSLCQFWRLDGPALIHFTTEKPLLPVRSGEHGENEGGDDEDGTIILSVVGDGSEEDEYYPERPGFDKVYAHVVELPLKKTDDEFVTFLPGSFPSRFEQLRTVTSDDRLWEEYPRLHPSRQAFDRMAEYCKNMEKTRPHTYGRLVSAASWVTRFIGLEENDPLGEWIPYAVGIHLGSGLACIPIVVYSHFVDPGPYEVTRIGDEILAVLRHVNAHAEASAFHHTFADAIDKVLKSAAAAAPATSRPSPGA